MKTLRGGLLAATLLAILAACGGGQAAAPKADSGSNAGAAAASADANAGAVADTEAGNAAPAGAASGSSITISGAKSFTISTPGSCSMSDLLGTEDWGGSFQTDGDDFWMFTLDIRKFAGAGEYPIVSSEIVGKAFAGLTDMRGTSFDSIKGGTLTVGDGGTSGSIDADLEGDGGTMHVSGSFTCEMD